MVSFAPSSIHTNRAAQAGRTVATVTSCGVHQSSGRYPTRRMLETGRGRQGCAWRRWAHACQRAGCASGKVGPQFYSIHDIQSACVLLGYWPPGNGVVAKMPACNQSATRPTCMSLQTGALGTGQHPAKSHQLQRRAVTHD